jgi:hypothetical protein
LQKSFAPFLQKRRPSLPSKPDHRLGQWGSGLIERPHTPITAFNHTATVRLSSLAGTLAIACVTITCGSRRGDEACWKPALSGLGKTIAIVFFPELGMAYAHVQAKRYPLGLEGCSAGRRTQV